MFQKRGFVIYRNVFSLEFNDRTVIVNYNIKCKNSMALAGYPSTDYAARTVVTHLFDYGYTRFEMGYASAIATMLFIVMILCNKLIQSALRKGGT